MRRATAQLTFPPGRPTPDPATAPETTCVVDQRVARVGGGEDDGRGDGLGAEALGWAHFDDLRPERRMRRQASRTPSAATRPATIGDVTAGIRTFETIPSVRIAPLPAATNVEPTMPPMRACDEDDGSPNHHVARFYAIAPMSPPKIPAGVTTSPSTMLPATVAATFREMKAPTKFSSAATVTATFGLSAPVAIIVAMALAVGEVEAHRGRTASTTCLSHACVSRQARTPPAAPTAA
jgi:hypothetical protein